MSFIPSAIPQRLSKLYSDTKQSYDVVSESGTLGSFEDSDVLLRKFWIQKQRFMTWGLEWTEDGAASPDEIGEAIARAGLTETTTSLIAQVGQITNEFEDIRRRSAKAKSPNTDKTSRSDAPIDYVRYESLVRDLTDINDILHDLSQSRRSFRREQNTRPMIPLKQSKAKPSPFSKEYSASAITLVTPPLPNVSLRTGLPPKIDVSSLTLPRDDPPPYDSDGTPSSSHIIGRLHQSYSSTNPWKTSSGKDVQIPVLIEYANYDAAYRDTMVSPPDARLLQLLGILVKCQSESRAMSTLVCLGYFEDAEHPRIGFVYELPQWNKSVVMAVGSQHMELKPSSLHELLKKSSSAQNERRVEAPPLEHRFRLALRILQTVSKMHESEFEHGNMKSQSIMLFRKSLPLGHAGGRGHAYFDIRQPYITSFDVFSRYELSTDTPKNILDMYKHPDDPRLQQGYGVSAGPTQSQAAVLQYEMYSMSLLLLEIGLWTPLRDLWKTKYTLKDFKNRLNDIWIPRLYAKCGTAYASAVKECFSLVDRMADSNIFGASIQQTYNRAFICLQRCCLLDDSDPFDDDIAQFQAIPNEPSFTENRMNRQRSVAEKGGDRGSFPANIVKRMSLEKDTERRHSKRSSISDFRETPKVEHSSLLRRKPVAHPNLYNLSTARTLRDDDPSTWPLDSAVLSSTDPSTWDESSLYSKESTSNAVSTIQRAWRSRAQKKANFKEYKHKVTLIQNQWRQRLALRSERSSEVRSVQEQSDSNYEYPTPDLEVPIEDVSRIRTTADHFEQPSWDIQLSSRPVESRLQVHHVIFSPNVIAEWDRMTPRLEKLLSKVLKDSPESVSVDLAAIGDTPAGARPTILVTCTSTGKVKAALKRKFVYDIKVFDLKVRKGRIRRSKLPRRSRRRGPHRSIAESSPNGATRPDLNPHHQQRPLCGASIGCYDGVEHYPPVTFGGILMIDNDAYGMTVHHGLDAPSDEDEESDADDEYHEETVRASMPRGPAPVCDLDSPGALPYSRGFRLNSAVGSTDEMNYSYELDDEDSDDESGYESADFDDLSDEEEEDSSDIASDAGTEGDVEGWGVGDAGEDLKITQPAFDDVADGFFPSPEDAKEEHLGSHEFGYVHASSGIRRWRKDGIVHEIDWALLKLDESRLQPHNLIQGGKKFCARKDHTNNPRLRSPVIRTQFSAEDDEYPKEIATGSLAGVQVHCVGRTSGLTGGVISGAMSSVRIYKRRTFSRQWKVEGGLGVPGDSGAWVIDNDMGRVCGHVLAWCEKNQIAYICPMQILIEDMKRELNAETICLPGGVPTHLPSSKDVRMVRDVQYAISDMKELRISDPPPQRARVGPI